jgi:eukaryotic-like serine/threonine-protein kinase
LALTPGTRLGVDDINAQIGVGGMGEVYRATDSNLKRSVAIEVLPASVAGDADRVARFSARSRGPRGLQPSEHPGVYGLEKTPDLTALLMELVEGEDLSQRIAPGAISVDEAFADREADCRSARSSASRLRSVKDCHPEAGAVRW